MAYTPNDAKDEPLALGFVTNDCPCFVSVAYSAERNSTKDRWRPADIAKQNETLDAVNVVGGVLGHSHDAANTILAASERSAVVMLRAGERRGL